MSPVSKNSLFGGDYCWEKFPHVYAKAINLCRKLTEAYDEALKKCDVLIMPTTITPADPLPAEGDVRDLFLRPSPFYWNQILTCRSPPLRK